MDKQIYKITCQIGFRIEKKFQFVSISEKEYHEIAKKLIESNLKIENRDVINNKDVHMFTVYAYQNNVIIYGLTKTIWYK